MALPTKRSSCHSSGSRSSSSNRLHGYFWFECMAALAITIIIVLTLLPPNSVIFAPPQLVEDDRAKIHLESTFSVRSTSSTTTTKTSSFSRPTTSTTLNVSELYLLAFGTSRTAGIGLLHPENDAFVNVLSPHVLNLAVPGGDVDYASLCLSSLLGDDQTFHAIIVESKPDESLLPFLRRLLIRLRRRFPNAPIIFLGSKPPASYVHVPTGMTIYPWMLSQGITERNDDLLIEHLKTNSTSKDWVVWQEGLDNQRQVALSATSNVHYLQYPPNWYIEDSLQFLIRTLDYFDDQVMPEHSFSHFSVLGHQIIANGVRNILIKLHHRPNNNTSNNNKYAQEEADHPVMWWNRTQPWLEDSRDHCSSWFHHGTLHQDKDNNNININNMNYDNNNNNNNRTTPMVQTNMKLGMVKNGAGKWALEVSPEYGGYLTISNPSNRPANVYIDHMKLYPETDQYPLTRATLGNNDTSVDLNPRFDYDIPFPAHVTSTAFVGKIGPRVTTNITFTPLETGMANPFRITGFVVTPTDKQFD